MPDSPSEDASPSDGVLPQDDTGSPEPVKTESQDESSAPSPEKTPAEKPSMLDAVKAAIKPKAKEASPSSEQDGADPKKGSPDSKDDKSEDELSQDELNQLSKRTRRRIEGLTKQLAAKDKEAEGLRTRAGEYDKIETFVRNSGLTNEVVGATLQIAALMRSNPREALSRLIPVVRQLQDFVGETVPDDLAQRVRSGFLTEEDARALARSRADAAMANRRASEMAAQQEVETRRQSQQRVVDTTVGTIETWEAQKAKSDPEWNLKRDEIAELVELAIERKNREQQQTNPAAPPWFPNSDEAVKLSQDAYDRVNERYKRFTPKPTEIRPVVSGGASSRTVAPPKSMLDVVRAAVGKAA